MREFIRKNERLILIILIGVVGVGVIISILKSDYIAEPEPEEYHFDLTEEGDVIPPVEFLVQVEGCVENPGIYRIEPGCRVEDAIEMAGGTTPEADPECLNLVMFVVDGMRIYVPEKGSPQDRPQDYVDIGIQDGEDLPFVPMMVEVDGKVNINTAGVKELTKLPGIGEGLAKEIVRHREETGLFERVDDIMEVSGIGKITYKRIEPYIVVGE